MAAAPIAASDPPREYVLGLSDWAAAFLGEDTNQGLTSFPSLQLPMGGRSEALGTAFSALADDPSFLDWNPAGSATLKTSELAIFHNNWIADSKIDSAVFVSRFNDFGWAAGAKWLYLPFSEYDSYGDRVAKAYYSEAIAAFNLSYNFGSTIYFDGIAVGANLKTAARLMPDYTDNYGTTTLGSGLSQSAVNVIMDVGALTRFNFLKAYYSRERNFAVAAVIRNLGLPAAGEAPPTDAVIGFAYKPFAPLNLSADICQPINIMDPIHSERLYGAFGLNAAISAYIDIRAGALVKAAGSRFTLGTGLGFPGFRFDFTYSVDLLTRYTLLNRLSIAARLDFGDGGRAERLKQTETLYAQGLGEFAKGAYELAIRLFDEALALTPSYEPALRAKQSASDAMILDISVETVLKLD